MPYLWVSQQLKWWGSGCQCVYCDVRAVVSVLWCSHYQVLWSQFWTREYWNVKVVGIRVLRCHSLGYWDTSSGYYGYRHQATEMRELWVIGYWYVRVLDVRVLRHSSSGNQANEMLGFEMSEYWVSGYQDIIFTNKTNSKQKESLTPPPKKKRRRRSINTE